MMTYEARPVASRHRDRRVVIRQPRIVERRHAGRAPIDMPWLAPPALLRHGLFSTWPAGSILLRAGERAQHVDILLDGELEERVGRVVICRDEPGVLLGADGAVDGHLSASTITARSLSVVVTVSAHSLRLAVGNPEVQFWLTTQRDERDLAISRAGAVAAALEATASRWDCG
ncbi:MAG: cyclic nucleotide-binding domain-containing protein [Acidimicrobiales bacterium]